MAIYDAVTKAELLDASSGASGLSIGHWVGVSFSTFYEGYQLRIGEEVEHAAATHITSFSADPDGASFVFTIATTDFLGRSIHLVLDSFVGRTFSLSGSINNATDAAGFEDFQQKMLRHYVPQRLASAAHLPPIPDPLPLDFPTIGWGLTSRDRTEQWFGFGQRWNSVDQRGNIVNCYVEDGSWAFLNDEIKFPTLSNTTTYLPIPLVISSTRGFGVLLDVPTLSTLDIAHSDPDAVFLRADGSQMRVRFFLGTTPAQTLSLFTRWRGATLIPPQFEFCPWKQFGSVVTNLTELQTAELFVEKDIPVCLRQGYTHWFPGAGQRGQEAALKVENDAYHALGIKSTTYFNPMVSPDYLDTQGDSYAWLASNQYFTKNTAGTAPFTFQYMDFKGCSQIDFTNPAARKWYQSKLNDSVYMGFDGMMYDFGEYTPMNSLASDGRTGYDVHNIYPDLQYQEAAFDYFVNQAPGDTHRDPRYAPEYVYFVRSGYIHTGKYNWAHWTGDPSANWDKLSGLPAQITACLTSGLSGVPFCGSDIGGYVCQLGPTLDIELMLRWLQYGTFAGIMRDETQGSSCFPGRAQALDTTESTRIWRKFSKLRTVLFPYIYTAAHQAHETGLPITRQHILMFPTDPYAIAQQYQYMFGDAVLVAPVITNGTVTQSVYLPNGAAWYDFSSYAQYDELDGRFRIGYGAGLIAGGVHVDVKAPLDTVPLFVRARTVIMTLDPTVDTVNNATDPRVVSAAQLSWLQHLWVFPDAAGYAAGAVYDGTEMVMQGGWFNVTADPLQRTFVVQIVQSRPVTSVQCEGVSLPERVSWENIVVQQQSASGAWTWDVAQETVWFRMPPQYRHCKLYY
eukprot:TRINITY_DN5382_c0_g1_i1.p1 TRINITY_DN5382_c0_g1~~TRINITY_DN5382_c0_g1_i1.p1  ORF type:complete len:914 (+),score=168.10 TRINITY_DN5382_c0_g1_i1:197-2743(+)